MKNRVIVSGGDPERVGSALISGGLFRLLGIEPALGRNFSEADDSPAAAPVALISDALWTRRYGSDPDILSGTIRIDGTARSIVGVMPPGFRFPEFAHVWLPLAPSAGAWKRDDRSLTVVARLREGVTLEQARAEMRALAGALERTYPMTNARWSADVSSLRADMTSETAMASLILMSAVGFVLLIACANVANLLLVRASERRRVRSADRRMGVASDRCGARR